MHANYLYLLALDGASSEAPSEALTTLEAHAAQHFDENNWFMPCVLIEEDGTLHQMAGVDDPRGRDDFYDRVQEVEPARRFQWARELAWKCLITEAGLGGPRVTIGFSDRHPIDTLTEPELEAYFWDEAQKRLVARLNIPVEPVQTEGFDSALYEDSQLGRLYFGLLNASNRPFLSSRLSPYEARTGDLTQNEPGNAILIVDIHT
jgi:hypothetical protein